MEDVENFLQVPVLAVVPKNISNLINESDDNPDAEAYRIMRTNIEFNRKNPDANTVTIVSGGTGEGKSTTMSNIAGLRQGRLQHADRGCRLEKALAAPHIRCQATRLG